MESRLTGFLAPNSAGRGYFCSFLCRSSLRYARYLPLLAPRTEQKSPPSPTTPLCRYSLVQVEADLDGDVGGNWGAVGFGGGLEAVLADAVEGLLVESVTQRPFEVEVGGLALFVNSERD